MIFPKPPLEDVLMHYGVKRRSGRYPWGSGDSPYQHSGDFLSRVEELKKQGLTENEIVKELGVLGDKGQPSPTKLRTQVQLAKHERRELEVQRAKSLREDGYSLNEIAEKMGYANDSSIRSLLNDNTAANKNMARNTADKLKEELQKKGMLDVGEGVERELGVSKTKLQESLAILEMEGYNVYPIGIPQTTNPGRQSNTKILCNPDIDHKYVYQHMGDIQSVTDYYSNDGGSTYRKIERPSSIDSKRVQICYGDEGGLNKDGVIEIRRGVKDLSLGNSHYAQVRIMVDGTHYLKGMAIYADDLPDGVDIRFNTNKKSGTPKTDVMKKIKEDPDNPFGAAIKANGQSFYDDPKGKFIDPITGKKQSLSAINKLKEEGDWDSMSRNLSSQFLSKQPMQLINRQLNLTYDDYAAQFDEICRYTNPTIKRKLLEDFADSCDSATVHLKAAALPRQKTQVILPLNAMKENEIYAPNYRDGEQVALVRYPHGGTFEIPVLTVNNKNKTARSILGADIRDAVGINAKVAERLSGADFDGDQVVVIPTNSKVRIKSTPALDGLKDFDPKTQYAYREGMKIMTKSETQKQMGVVSNLITDMTLRGATDADIVKAVKHSMVVIDAEKHKLDYKRSEVENDIATLKKRYQVHTVDGVQKEGGASTLISKKKQDVRVNERQGSGVIDKETGVKTYKESGRKYVDKKTGELVNATEKVKLMNTVKDAYTLSSGTPQEDAYADYANKMKALANQARKEMVSTPRLKYSPSAKELYQNEVNSLDAKLNVAAKNAPRERRAQVIANSVVKAKIQDNPTLEKDKKALKKEKQIAINNARAAVSARGKESKISITDKEWEAIQAGAISDAKLSQILRYANKEEITARALPRTSNTLSQAQINKAKSMRASGYTNAEIAEALGCSTSTISKQISA